MDTNKNSGLDMLVLEQVDRILAMRQERDRAIARAETAEAALAEYKADIPWESMWAYFSHGDYGPDDWQEVDEWIRTNMPRGIARTWLGMPEVQP